MDEVYKGYRIATKIDGERWRARVSQANGSQIPIMAGSRLDEGEAKCVERARAEIDRYLHYLSPSGSRG